MQFRHWESWRQFRKIICPLPTFKMPRKRDRVTNRASWTEGDLRMAKEYMESHGCSMRTASIKFSIPYSTFKERVLKGKTGKPKMGCEPVFNENQEREMVQHILHLSNLFYGLTPTHLRKVAYEFAEANNIKHPFNKNSKMADYDWLQGLIKRNPVISIRKPEATSVNRITAFNRDAVGRFFDNLESVMAKQQFPPERIFNMDETGITTVSEPVKVLSEKGKKRIGTVTSWERGKNVTVICAMSATGIFVPPMFVFARKKMSSLLSTNGPRGAAYECSDNGWSNEVLFIKWLHHFVKHTTASPENPLLLILDNHCSHTTLEGYELCRNNGITLLSIPPHPSHRTQPLDVTFYGPLKTLFRQKSYAFMKQVDGFSNESRPKRSDGLVQITPYDLASIFNAAYVEAAKLSVAISGFKNTGIFPLNRNIFTDNDFLPSEVLAGQSPPSMVEGIDLPAPSPGTSATPAIPANSQVEDTPSLLLPSSNSPPSTSSCPFRSFADMPTPAAAVKKNTRSKQHSEILTATPRKLVLLEKRQAKFEKKRKETKRAEKKAKRPVKVALDFRCSTSSNNENAQPKEKPGNKRNLRESKRRRKQPYEDDTDSEELDDPSTEELCDDNDCDDAEGIEDLCTICQEYEKDAPLWMCNECHHKAHYFCSGGYPPRGLCDLCENLL